MQAMIPTPGPARSERPKSVQQFFSSSFVRIGLPERRFRRKRKQNDHQAGSGRRHCPARWASPPKGLFFPVRPDPRAARQAMARRRPAAARRSRAGPRRSRRSGCPPGLGQIGVEIARVVAQGERRKAVAFVNLEQGRRILRAALEDRDRLVRGPPTKPDAGEDAGARELVLPWFLAGAEIRRRNRPGAAGESDSLREIVVEHQNPGDRAAPAMVVTTPPGVTRRSVQLNASAT